MKTIFKIIYKKILPVVVLLFSVSEASAQTGIGTLTPDKSAALEIKSTTKGLLIPRLTTNQKNAMPSPATGIAIYDTDLNCLSVNKGTPAAPVWDCTVTLSKKSFYMPSINIPTNQSLVGVTQTTNLYAQYLDNFATPEMASQGAPANILHFANPTDLYYYVTYYDPALIQIIGIDANGVLTYKLLKTANLDSYINIVFMPK